MELAPFQMTSPLTEFQPLAALRGSPHWVTASFAPLDTLGMTLFFSVMMCLITFPNVSGLGDSGIACDAK